MRYFEKAPPINNVDCVANCLFVQWTTGDLYDHTAPKTYKQKKQLI